MNIPRILPLLLIFLLLLTCSSAFSQLTTNRNGQLDRSYGSNGIAEMETGYYFQPVAFGSDESIFTVSERPTWPSNVLGLYVFKHLADGTLDPAYGHSGTASITLSSNAYSRWISVLADGKVLVGGYLATADGGSDLLIVRFLSNGDVDQSFGVNGCFILNISPDPGHMGAITNDVVDSMVVLPDGRILASAVSDQLISDRTKIACKAVLFCLFPSGVLDSSFAVGGVSTMTLGTRSSDNTSSQDSMLINLLSNGSILAGASFYEETSPGTLTHSAYLIKYHPEGSLDPGFGVGGVRNLDNGKYTDGSAWLNDFIELGSGKILCSGSNDISRLNSDGSTDLTFGSNGIIEFPVNHWSNNKLIAMTDGTFIASGTELVLVPAGGYYLGEIRRFLPNGDPDIRFGRGGRSYLDTTIGRDIELGSIRINSQGSLTVVGHRIDTRGFPKQFTAHISIKRKL